MLCAGIQCFQIYRLWFDVGVKRYTTGWFAYSSLGELWFDVGVKRYTTPGKRVCVSHKLWFDVGVKRYTTRSISIRCINSCGLM